MTPTALLTLPKWTIDDDRWLQDFVAHSALPHLALVTRGQYLSIGAPSHASPGLIPYILLHSTHRVRKVVAQVLRLKDSNSRTKKTPTEHKCAIPETFQGYFEILSEDGRPVGCLESVVELYRAFPELALVRSSTKAYLPDGDGELRSLYRTRTLQEGEVLTLVGQFNFRKVLFLRCFDSEGGSVYLKLGQKGRFSAVARPDSLSGVHTVASLITKRLPLTVKLLSPSLPSELSNIGPNIAFQLQAVFSEELVFAQAVSRNHSAYLAIPLNAHLKLAPARNHSTVRGSSEFQRLCAAAEEQIAPFLDKIAPFNDHGLDPTQLQSQVMEEEPPADPASYGEVDRYGTTSSSHPSDPPPVSDREIDQLYDYIRGLAPLPDSCHESRDSLPGGRRPPPPPVETIPSRKSNNSTQSRSGGGWRSPSRRSKSPAPVIAQERYRRLSKSTEKIGLIPPPEPLYLHPPPKRLTPVRRHSEKKKRPLSMVLTDPSAAFLHPPSHYYAPGPQPQLYRSLANLAVAEEPFHRGGFYPHYAPVYPRFAPRYAFSPPYRLG